MRHCALARTRARPRAALGELLRYRGRIEVRIAPEHLPGLVSGDRGDLRQAETALEKPAGRLVPQVVEAQILDFGLCDRSPPRVLEAVGPVPDPEDARARD